MQTIETRVELTTKGRRVTARASMAGKRVSYVIPEDDSPGNDFTEHHAAACKMLMEALVWDGVRVGGHTRRGMIWVDVCGPQAIFHE